MKIPERLSYTLSSPKCFKAAADLSMALLMPRSHSRDVSGAHCRALKDCKSVLVIKMDRIGDFFLAIPALRNLRNNLPQARLDLVTQSCLGSIVEGCPYIDNSLRFDPVSAESGMRFKRHIQSFRLAREKLWSVKYDAAIVLRWDFDLWHGAYLAYLSGARLRIGYPSSVSEIKRDANKDEDRLFNKLMTNDVSMCHEVERNLNILSECGLHIADKDSGYWLSSRDSERAREIVAANGLSGRKLVAVAPGAWESRKRWPAERYIQLIKLIVDRHDVTVLLFGSGEDKALANEIVSSSIKNVCSLAGDLSLRESVSVLSVCDLYIGNDTGVKHMAASVGVKVVEICGYPSSGDGRHPLSPLRFGAYGTDAVVVHPSNGGAYNIDLVDVDAVFAQVSRKLAQS